VASASEVYTTAPGVQGAAVWIPPDSGPMSEERWAAAGFEEVAVAIEDGVPGGLHSWAMRWDA
jgi:hypothetical protein